MNIIGFDVKIIGGKIIKIPITSTDGKKQSTSRYLSSDDTPKFGSQYRVLPDISDHRNVPDKLSQQVTAALLNIAPAKLQNVYSTFKRLDSGQIRIGSGSDQIRTGRITTKELNDVFLLHNIFILGETRTLLIKRFEVEGGGILYDKLWAFLEECHTVSHQAKTKLNGYQQPLNSLVHNQRTNRTEPVQIKSHQKPPPLTTRHSSNLTSIQTQTNTGDRLVIRRGSDDKCETPSSAPDPVFVNIRGRKVFVYPPDKLLDHESSPDPPEQKPVLEWVYGYRGNNCRNNLYVLRSGELIYFTAAVVIIYNHRQTKQRHYTEHTDDVKSMAVHPDGVTVATGQVAGHEEVQGEPHIRIWCTDTLHTKMVVGLGYFERAVVSVAFSSRNGVDQGRYLVTVDESNYHTITVWDWARNKKIANARGHMDQVLTAEFSPFDNKLIVSCGKQHVSFWTLDEDNKLRCDRGRFDRNIKPKYVTCITFSKDGDVITGDSNGNIFFWPEGSNQISNSIKNAHEGPVFFLYILKSGVLLSAGGRDRSVRAWDQRLLPLNVDLKFPPSVTGIRTLVVDELNTLYAGTVNNSIYCTELAIGLSPLLDVGRRLKVVVEGHADDLRGLAAHPMSSTFITAGGDKTIKFWDADFKTMKWTARLPAPAQAVDISSIQEVAAVGHKDGSFVIVELSSGELLFNKKCSREKISALKFSPDGVQLAVASHDNNIYIYKMVNDGKSVEMVGKCSGHSSYVTHFDWSADSSQLQSTSGDYELLFWDALTTDRITSSGRMRNTKWATFTCVLGYPVLGIWPKGADGTDVNTVDRSHSQRLLATGDDFGDVNVFQYPCTDKKAKPRVAKGHSAHVTCVRFLHDDSRLISVGGRDASVMQWRIT